MLNVMVLLHPVAAGREYAKQVEPVGLPQHQQVCNNLSEEGDPAAGPEGPHVAQRSTALFMWSISLCNSQIRLLTEDWAMK